jgi:1-acyl-sn-glycerol-3-phosphate acyltransferase
MLALRSLLFSVTMILSTIVIAVVLVVMAPTPFVWRSRAARLYAAFVMGALRLLCGIDYRVEGRENLPPGAAIIFSKHQSTWETYALQLIFPAQTWVLKRELMWVPFFGWGLATLKPVAIDRQAGRKAVKQVIEQGTRRLAEGIWITVFPGGTRVAPGQHKRWGIGGALLAEKSGYPVVPVAHNAGELWGRRAFLKKPGTVQVVIGPPIETQGKSAGDINQQAEAWMNDTMARISHVPMHAEVAVSR